MCGIAGFTGRDRAVPYLIDCLERLEYRGYDSSGIALCRNNDIDVIKRSGKLSELKKAVLCIENCDCYCGIGHTRWATHGSPTENNAHPHLSQSGTFAIVHNGIIENYAQLKGELENDGVSFISDTDSEVIAQLLEKNYDGSFSEAARKTLFRLDGAFAFAAVCKDFPGKIFCAKKGSPLVLCRNEMGVFISSDVTSVVSYTDSIYRLEDGECAFITADSIEFFDFYMREIEKSSEKLTVSADDAKKQGYEHFMLKEIFEQEQTVNKTVLKHVRGDDICFEGADLLFENADSIKRIVFIGCGSAYHVCLSAKYVTESLAGICCSAEVASEWRYSASPVDSGTLCVFISQSGETADTLAALEKAKNSGAITLSIVNVPSSSLAVKSEFVIYTAAGAEIAVATTKAYTAQLITVYLIALKFAGIKGKPYKKMLGFIKSSSGGIAEIFSGLLTKIQNTAQEIYKSKQIYFIGRNTDYPAALEGALKLKEVSYIPCEAYPAGELKHGTISLIEKGTVVVALAGNSDVLVKILSNVKEVKARGARIIAVGSIKDISGDLFSAEDRVIAVPFSESVFSALYEGVVLQLLAYYVAKNRGCDIDMPRNLAKSVTVE